MGQFPIVEPDSGHTKIRLVREGLEAIQRIKNPIAVVGVISFGVGMWVWGTPVELDIDGTKVSILYLDTEGFESVGKSNVYDDR
ncbi:hypothetical protein GW17_00000371 [Ensete ventricosum]|nr:hypothetical protein GW17_00000371 [Ensete ventricosum]RZR78875.1 hypothetical protein BHM03_00004425 [Ensete ventricosum]